ncbi:MAG: pseudouridine synthase [Archaeoglobaceae archaeon]|nr:pseudouridine synthase [Archaeoglobaceae archaeon]MCX8152194.1 pseudouridine synthase [Archaeoglobaceae archaeon]MDW8013910.1 PUA domain-containing protein [Archaeoglobaceae archaeon]
MVDSLRIVRTIADYQFGKGAGKALFPETCSFIFSTTGKVRQIFDEGKRIATLVPDSGLLTISIEGAKRLQKFFPFPKLRVVVLDEVSEFIASGKSVFAKHVVYVDEKIRAGDEVLVVNTKDSLLATGKALLSAYEMLEVRRGVAVKVRQGVKK